MSDVYSYHTFIFPFVWEGRGKRTVTLDEFRSLFENNVNWENIHIPDEHHVSLNPLIRDKKDILLFHKEYQYFHPYARKALYGFSDDVVSNYSFRTQDIQNKAHYYIECTVEEKDEQGESIYCLHKYDLLVNGIRLKIYNTGIALFVLECENHGVGVRSYNGEQTALDQRTLDAAKRINDYGRRISLPYIPTPPFYSTITAERLVMDVKGVGTFVSDYRGFAEELSGTEDITDKLSLTHFCDFIKKILAFGRDDISFTSRLDEDDKKSYYIYPALDDRMFVTCYIKDSEALWQFSQRDDNGKLLYLENERLSKSLHELIAIDPPGNCCTQDPDMRRKYIEEHTYLRWIQWGTLITYTNQSLINLTTSDCPEYMEDSFLSQYVQLCCLVLVQRTSIINFQRQTSAMSARIRERGKRISLSTVSEITKLQERFVAFQNQLSFTEVTPQDQGIEIYDKLMEMSFVEKEIHALKEQLDCLSDAANTSLDYNFNKYALIFAIPTVLIEAGVTLFDVIHSCADRACSMCDWMRYGKFGVYGLAVALVLIMLGKYRRR